MRLIQYRDSQIVIFFCHPCLSFLNINSEVIILKGNSIIIIFKYISVDILFQQKKCLFDMMIVRSMLGTVYFDTHQNQDSNSIQDTIEQLIDKVDPVEWESFAPYFEPRVMVSMIQ